MALNERDPSGRHQFRDADAKTRVGTGTDEVINGCADTAQPSLWELLLGIYAAIWGFRRAAPILSGREQ